jgi:hypothetical protein
MKKVLKTSRLPLALLLAVAFTFSAACSKSDNTTSGPAAAGRAYYEAINRKDVAAAKRYLSAGSIVKLGAEAKDLGKTFDVAYREAVDKIGAEVMPSFNNEKISGDTATVDMKAQGQTVTALMVKESGEWKMAIDKMFPNQRVFDSPTPTTSPTQVLSPAEDKEEEGNDEHNGHEDK